ncbi:MAG: YdiU family protein, partial [Myxococcales bacterium]|nr:YdiU family protein [Myxococcales bacterium]
AMEALGVPTTRALALVGTGDDVLRDMFYDGRAAWEPGAIVCRVAPTFLRFGNAQIFTSRRDEATLRALLEFTLANIGEWDADLIGVARTAPVAPVFESRPLSSEAVVSWFAHVCTRTAEMVVEWMRVGFVHGVMNTDNMSILGLTIDYGPYGWLDVFDPTWTPNTTDAHGRRYRFGAQPAVAFWNLARFAEALVPLVDDPHELETALGAYSDTFSRRYALAMAQKLGLGELRDEDEALIDGLFERMGAVETDYTLLFRCLAKVDLGATLSESASAGDVVAPIVDAWYSPDAVGASERRAWADWLRSYARRVRDEGSGAVARRAQLERMARMNPVYVPRNYLAQEAIDALSAGDSAPLEAWFARVTRPYDEVEGGEHYAAKRPEWARHRAGCSMLSCSS